MKHNVILFSSLLLSGIATAQNTNPWPATGNIGIGTATPGAPLHLHNATSGVPLLKISDAIYNSTLSQDSYNTTFDASAGFTLKWGSGAKRNEMVFSGGSGTIFYLNSYGALVNGYGGFRVGHQEKFGFVTIGTSTTYNAIGAAWVDNSNAGISFFTKNAATEAEAMRLTNTGRLGIGTTTPATSLHVNGAVTINNSITGSVSHANLILGDGQGSQLNWGTGANMSRVMCGGPVTLWTNNAERLRVNPQGYVGINTSSPAAMLHVNGTVKLDGLVTDDTKDKVLVTDANGNVYARTAASLGGSSASAWQLDGSTAGAIKKFGTKDNYDLPLITNNVEAMRVTATGNVGIGTANPQAKLAVNGDVYAKKVKVTASSWPAWPDYVFEASYDLPSLASVEAFIKKNRHLPEVPSAKEVQAKGIDLGDNQALLLKKIEELTLYVIEQNKKIEALQKEMKEMKK